MGLPILIRTRGAFKEQAVQDEVPHAPLALPWADASLLHRLGEGPDGRAIDRRQIARGQPWTFAPTDRGQDSRTLWFSGCRRLVAQAHLAGRQALEVQSDRAVGKKNQRLDEGAFEVAKGTLPGQQTLEPFALAVGKDQRAVVAAADAFVFPDPVVGIAGDSAGFALDLDQKDALGAGNEGVDLVDRAVVGDELKIGPGDVIVLGRKACANEIQGFLFPGEARRRNDFPMFFRHSIG